MPVAVGIPVTVAAEEIPVRGEHAVSVPVHYSGSQMLHFVLFTYSKHSVRPGLACIPLGRDSQGIAVLPVEMGALPTVREAAA